MLEMLRGYAVVSLCGWAVYPLVHRSLGSLPDRGYSLCRCFGWVLAGWLSWNLAWITGRPLTTPLAVGTIVLVGVTCWLPAILRRRRTAGERGNADDHPVSFLCLRPGLIAVVEGLFLAGVLLFASLQARNPAVDPDSERFMDYAFLRACLHSPGLPVMDPWLAGREMAYYHFGYALVAFLVRACAADPARLFTTAISLLYALAWIGAFGIGLALTGRARGGAWAAFLVLGAGNLAWIRQGARVFLPGVFDWFAPSRAIAGTITEFPWFSLLWGDLHPYVIALPIVACALAILLADGLEAPGQDGTASTTMVSVATVSRRAACLALVGGAALATHPWDFPLLLVAAVAITTAGRGPRKIARLAAVLLAGLLSCLLFLPFLTGLAHGARGIGWVVGRSAAREWLLAYGPFVLLGILGFPMVLSRDRPATHETKENGAAGRLALALAACGIVAALLGEVIYVRDLFESSPLARMNTVFKLHRVAWLFLGLASSWILERLVAPRWGRMRGAGEPAARRRAILRRAADLAVVVVVLGASLVYPIFGTAAWLRAREGETRRTEDGPLRAALQPGADAEALFRELTPGDAAAASFIARSAGARDALLEETGDPYTWSSRISTFSGVPAVLGWGNHEAVWRQGWDEVLRRQADIAAIYTQPGSRNTCDLLRTYGVRWIVSGDRERRRYGAQVSDLRRLAQPAVASAGTEVYRVEDLCASPRATVPP